ncbi:MAG: hypothetical protein QGG67_14965 [Gammaproteobacteria bacterium]|jgi:hypothetical protein|nr:hypothetical protein [Gammaproteobacteria bacterium]MDP6097265.1 hypothetical protein [Gammaproteobacteria bacterium]|tara:strand:- start:684 stop:872 length:189 start_codon:yes stop_codon:yes gene_type:complete
MSKKKKADSSGTYALCITTGLIFGIGLGPVLGSVPIFATVGIIGGAAAGYYFTHQKKRGNKH